MVSLKAKQLLISAAKKQTKKEEKINRNKINKRINQIKHLSSQKKLPKMNIRKEIDKLERELRGIFGLEKRLKNKSDKENKEINKLKDQIKELRKKLSNNQNKELKKKVERLSHLVGDVMAKKEIRKEVEIEKEKKKSELITLNKIDELQERILRIEHTGKIPKKKIDELKKKLSDLEKKVEFTEPEEIKHKMMIGPPVKPPKLSQESEDALLLPPPPKITE